jgi:hypothetical protein
MESDPIDYLRICATMRLPVLPVIQHEFSTVSKPQLTGHSMSG